ncbi:MAG: TATA-box-binding protein C [Halobacteriaceae archaeon]
MTSLSIENVVATGDLDTQIKYSNILGSVDIPHVRYDPDIHQGLELRFTKEGPLVTLYATGKYIIRASSMELLFETREKTLNLLSEIGLLDEPQDVAFEINNVVGSGSVGREVALEPLETDLEIEETVYNPENFPALRCKLNEHDATVLLYRSGKIIITGANSVEGANDAYDDFQSVLNNLFDLEN